MPAWLQALDLSYSKLPALALLGAGPSSHLAQLGLDVSQAAGLAAALSGLAGLTRLDLQLCLPPATPMTKGDIVAAAAAAYLAAPTQVSSALGRSAGRSQDESLGEGSGSVEEDNWVKQLLMRRLHTEGAATGRQLFPKAATMLRQVVEAALCMPALRQVCAHCDKAAQRRRDWLYCSQQLRRVVKTGMVEIVIDVG